MKVLYIHQYFQIPRDSGATRSYWFAKKLVDNGIKVTMLTSTNKHFPEAGHVDIEGIDVLYVKNAYSQYFSKARKVYSFVKFVVQAIWNGKKQKDVDLMYATSTPLTVGFIALVLHKLKGWPYIFEVRDLWPEFPIQIGAIRNGLAIKMLRKLERAIYKNAVHVVALSPGMEDGVLKCGTPKEKVTMIPNMSKPDLFFPREKKDEDYDKYGIDKTKFNVVHAGAMGVANGLGYIIEAADILQNKMHDNSIHFVFAGGGATQPMLEKMASERGLKNVRFLGYFNTQGISDVMNLCDMSIVSFKNLPILYTNSPNKLFDSLSAGLPIIVNSAGWTKGIAEDEHCGIYVDPEHPEELAQKLIDIRDKKDVLKVMGENARRLSLEKFDKSILSEKFFQVVKAHLPS